MRRFRQALCLRQYSVCMPIVSGTSTATTSLCVGELSYMEILMATLMEILMARLVVFL